MTWKRICDGQGNFWWLCTFHKLPKIFQLRHVFNYRETSGRAHPLLYASFSYSDSEDDDQAGIGTRGTSHRQGRKQQTRGGRGRGMKRGQNRGKDRGRGRGRGTRGRGCQRSSRAGQERRVSMTEYCSPFIPMIFLPVALIGLPLMSKRLWMVIHHPVLSLHSHLRQVPHLVPSTANHHLRYFTFL